ncbi:unnamed protein product [Macrosiphum euphorbiae]|uniref:Uncharacterized protein n=1 Tax=Macrosiphum euphorbiae TaxID=13131 RepID=A0AAV0YCE8_9HEMI|nr:unnamed protein product [Macrosiphum euphorbiae]
MSDVKCERWCQSLVDQKRHGSDATALFAVSELGGEASGERVEGSTWVLVESRCQGVRLVRVRGDAVT